MSLVTQQTIPILRIFSFEKAREFYVEFLGFTVDWEHRFDADFPRRLRAEPVRASR